MNAISSLIGPLFGERARLSSATVTLAFIWLDSFGLSAEGKPQAEVIESYTPALAAFDLAWLALAKVEDPAATVAAALDGFADDLEAMPIEEGMGAKVRAMVAGEAIVPAVKRLTAQAGAIPPRVEPTAEQHQAALHGLMGWVLAAPGLDGLAEALDALHACHAADGGGETSNATQAAWEAVEGVLHRITQSGMSPDDLRGLLDMWVDATPGAPRIAVNVAEASAPPNPQPDATDLGFKALVDASAENSDPAKMN